VRAGLVQTRMGEDASQGPDRLKKLMVDKNVAFVEEAVDLPLESLAGHRNSKVGKNEDTASF